MYKDTFFSALPSILSQSVFESFMAAFPKSQKHFEGAFKTAICDAFAKWMTGIVPTDPYWGSWIDPGSVVKKSLVAAAPQPPVGDIKRRASAAPQPIPTLAPHNKKDEALDVLSGALRDVSKKPIDLTPPPSCRIGPGPKVIRRPFDVYQNSPAVIQYMTLQGSRNNHCKITVHRSETVREPLKSTPSSSSVQSLPTYREILDASAESTKAALQSYHARIKNVQKERAALTKEIAATLAREKLKASFILARPELVKEKADKVVQGMHEQTKRRKEALLAKTRGQKIVFN